MKKPILERKALQVTQRSGKVIYLLSLKASDLLAISGISRVNRDDVGKLIGYQRAEVKQHVKEIADYLSTEDMLLAHPLILSFNSDIRFVSSRGQKSSDGLASAGMLEIPLPIPGAEKPAWIVDGQQRALAIEMLKDKEFAVPICAFVSDSIQVQRDQFLRINNSKPLPRGLVAELLPEVDSPLPPKLAVKKIPSALCELLNSDEKSPFYGLIKRPSRQGQRHKNEVITDTVIIRMIEESLTQPSGCLFPYRNIATGDYNQTAIWSVLQIYWTAIKIVFPKAWGRSPASSRLMHGVGIRAMGKLMDRIMSTIDPSDPQASAIVVTELEIVAPHCRWTDGTWEELGGIAWNLLQNVHKHQAMLSNFLIRVYLEKKIKAKTFR
jgi:DGQHR domain-containing protein